MSLTNEDRAILKILKNFSFDYNSNNLSKELGMTSMGSLKMLRRLESGAIVVSRKVSNLNLFSLNFENQYAKNLAALLLRKEADSSPAYVKRWVSEMRNMGIADIGVVFGSVLDKGSAARDIDVLFVLKKKYFEKLRMKIKELNAISDKKIHPVYQISSDFLKNLEKGDAVLFEAINGVVTFGERDFVNLLEKAK
ncbi:MAG: hypothetical protein KJ905_02500 [Nanoarchaeota archaeon]|nr:hypothetical protein [Nanoarchaeota archaeon]MBU1501621.1 hypothetical protein [Nanoarchaeota archaeon]